MLLSELVQTSTRVADTPARLEKLRLLSDFIRQLDGASARIGVAYLCGELPQGKLGVGAAQLSRLRGSGVAQLPTLELIETDAVLDSVRHENGSGSVERRGTLLGRLFQRATQPEQEFLVHLLLGDLRQGALEGVLVDAVARAFEAPIAAVRRAAMLEGDLPRVAEALVREGTGALHRFELQLFRPIQPMLADSATDVDDVLGRLGQAAVEYKMDGARVQVHKEDDRVEVYSRSLNRVTAAVPEIVEAVAALPSRRLVLDGEAIAFSRDARPLPFQITMRRFGRRLDVPRLRSTLPLQVYFFDLLRMDEQDLIDQPLAERWSALSSVADGAHLMPRLVTAQAADADAFMRRALQAGHEGVMAKSLVATYNAGRRGQDWLKLKPAHSLDLVILAAEWGNGRRRGWLSNLHLGARDPDDNSFVMLGKTFKGLTDAVLRWQTEALLALEIGREGNIVHVRPELVAEVLFSDVQRSPQYPGGVALRFARLKAYRPDKRAEQADTIATVRSLLPSNAVA
jgi:DNA ligase-1